MLLHKPDISLFILHITFASFIKIKHAAFLAMRSILPQSVERRNPSKYLLVSQSFPRILCNVYSHRSYVWVFCLGNKGGHKESMLIRLLRRLLATTGGGALAARHVSS